MRLTRGPFAEYFASRKWLFLLMTFCLLLVTGDQVNGQWFRNLRNSFGSNTNSANNIPAAFNTPPDQQQFLAWVLQHTANVKQVDARILVTMTGTPKLRGSIQIERPNRMRLKAGVLGMNEMGVDVGSNDELFWIWTRVALPGQSPTLMWADHESFRQSTSTIRKAVPLEPEWLIEALGLVDFSTYESHSQPTPQPGGRMQMISSRTRADGKQYRVTVFDARRGIIEQQSLYNQQGELIAFTNSSDHIFYPQHNISLPRRIELHLFQNGQEVTMLVTTDSYKINSLFGDPRLMWQMPDPSDVQRINLAPDIAPASRPPSQLPAGGYAPSPQQYRNDFRSVTYPGR
jgi:hypothetical protein